MNIVVSLGIVLGIAFLIQTILSMIQMKHFSAEFVKLRKKGKVVVGRKSGGFFAGAIVMFLIDENGIIKQGKKIEGVSCFAKVKDFPGFEGKYVGDISAEDGPDGHRNLKKALVDAASNYNNFTAGKEIKDTPSPLGKLVSGIKNR